MFWLPTVMVSTKLMFPLLLMLLPMSPCSAVAVSKAGSAQTRDDPAWSPLTVAQCRATCLREFSSNMTKNSTCMQDADCFMCWQNCELLHANWSVWGAICSKKNIVCSPGCRRACLFLLSPPPSQSSLPLSATRSLAQLLVSGSQLRWPPLPDKSHVVYVLMWSGEDGNNNWRQLQQTAELGAQLPTSPGTVRVMVVDPGGLLAVYTPVDSPLNIVASRADSTNRRRGKPSHRFGWFANDETTTSGWSVRVGSVLHQGLLVVTELSWRPPASDLEAVNQKGDGSALYLVTWEVDGGGVSGNLYTDDTCVTLSLWPDTVFHIAVQLVWQSATFSRSSPLLVDTSSMRHPLPDAQRSRRFLSSVMVSWIVLTGELVTVLFVAVACCRSCWQRRVHFQRQHTDKAPLVEEEEIPQKEVVVQPEWNDSQEDAIPC